MVGSEIKISLVASSIRPDLWQCFANSLKGNKIPYEVIFVGLNEANIPVPPGVKFIKSTTKPAQCYEIGFRHAQGELIHWTADDAEYELNSLDNIYILYEKQNDYKTIVAFTTVEDGRDCTDWHHLIGGLHTSPVMAPFGCISRQFLTEIGGYDRNFVAGQSENDLVMRGFEAGGKVLQSPYKVFVEHTKKHQGSSGTVFRAKGYYPHDRSILERAWVEHCDDFGSGFSIPKKRIVPFEPFESKDLETITQGPKGKWL